MTAFSRALILAGLATVTGASGALADGSDRNAARVQQGYEASASTQQAPVLQEGRASAFDGAVRQEDGRNWLTDRRSSDSNRR